MAAAGGSSGAGGSGGSDDEDGESQPTAGAAIRAALFIESGRALEVGFSFVINAFLKAPQLAKHFVEYNSADDLNNMSKAAGRTLQHISFFDTSSEPMTTYRSGITWKPKHVHWMTSKPSQNRFMKMCAAQGITAKFAMKTFETSGTRSQDFPTGYQESTDSRRTELECTIAAIGERKRKRERAN